MLRHAHILRYFYDVSFGLKGGISIDADSGLLHFDVAIIFFTFIKIRSGHTVIGRFFLRSLDK